MQKLIAPLLRKFKKNSNRVFKNLSERCNNLIHICAILLLKLFSYANVLKVIIRNMDQFPPNPAAPAQQNQHQEDDDDGNENNNWNDLQHLQAQADMIAAEIDLDDISLSSFSDMDEIMDEIASEDEDDDENGTDDDDDNMENMADSSDSDNSDNEEQNMNIDEMPIVTIMKLSDFTILNKPNYFNRKPTYAFKPYHLVRDKFLNNITDGIPAARSGHRIIANASNLYSLGGYNPRSALSAARDGRCMLFQELWRYNFATKCWKLLMNVETMPNMPRELASNALVMYNNVLISHGGTGYPFGESCSNDCYAFTTRDKPILARLNVTGELPTPLYGPAMVIHDDYLYTIGGTTGFDYSCDVFRLNLKTRVWENLYNSRPEMRDDPEGRYRHEIVYDGKYIYVLGGGTSLNVYDLQRLPAFNLYTNRWEYFDTLPDRTIVQDMGNNADENAGFPKPRKCFTCVQHKMDNGDIEAFITGGLQGDFLTYFADVWKLNIRTLQWTLIRTATLPKALYFHSAADTGHGQMYIFGGIEYDVKEMRRRNRVYKMWMTIPKLSEICWEAISYYNDHLCTHSPNTLLQNGVPKRFIERIEFLPKPFRYVTPSGSSAAANAGDTEEAQNPTSFACTTL